MIVSLNDYKKYLNRKVADTSIDDILTDIAEAVEADIIDALNYPVEEASHVDIYSGNNSYQMMLNAYPVTALTKVEEWTGSEWLQWTADSYTRLDVINQNYIQADGRVFLKGSNNYRITYTAGYATGSEPSQIIQAMKRLMKLRVDETPFGRNSLGLNSTNDSGGMNNSASIDKDDEARVFKSIERFARINV